MPEITQAKFKYLAYIVVSLVLGFGIGSIYKQEFTLNQDTSGETVKESTSSSKNESFTQVTVDVSGAVAVPGVYTLPSNSRLADAVKMAGGLSKHASVTYLSQSVNLAENVTDAQKIYIPFIFDEDISDRIMLDFSQVCDAVSNSTTNDRINVNSADSNQLVGLPGVGEVFAQKIIENRPYKDLAEFFSKVKFSENSKAKLEALITTE